MGRANGLSAEDPSSFLRKHAKESVLPDPAPPSSPKLRVKPPVPARGDAPVMGLMSDKDWVVANAVEAIAARPPQHGVGGGSAGRSVGKLADVDYTQRPGFGKVPTYLRRNKAAIADEQQQIETFMRMRDHTGGDDSEAAPMAEEERAELLAHLKHKWAAVNAAYLKTGFVLDIESKIKRKEALERELAAIEADIKLLQRGDVVMVLRDDDCA
ncbi:MAG: flagellar associated protein [Monoraphidium minutum]|nr:MAG: flagellar associated protein [Monoraphidium minutum]